MSRVRLLFLSGGSLVGRNVLATLAGRRESLALIAMSSVADEPGLFEFDAAYLAPRTLADPDAYERRLLEVIEREAPGNLRALPDLAALRRIDLTHPQAYANLLFTALPNAGR